MDTATFVSKALELSSANVELSSWSLEKVLTLAFDVSVLVKKSGASSKEENIVLLTAVIHGVLEHFELKELASLSPETSTDDVKARWAHLKMLVDVSLPLVFLHTPHLNLPKCGMTCFGCCMNVGNQVEPLAVPDAVASVDALKADAEKADAE